MSHKMAVLFRWAMVAQLWMVGIAWWDSNHLPSHITQTGLTPLDMLGVTTAAIAWHALILLAGLLAEYGLIVCGPLWVASEVVAWWKGRPVENPLRVSDGGEGQETIHHALFPR